jgi:hypothetical protein
MASEVHHHDISVEEQYEFKESTRRKALMAIIIGAVVLVAGLALLYFYPPHPETGGHGHGGHEPATTHETHTTHQEHATTHEQHGHEAELTPLQIVLKRLWAALWMNNVYFTGIAIIGVFFVAVQYVAQAGWSSAIKRVPESFGYFLPFTAVMMLVTFVLGGHDLFHWTHSDLYKEGSEHYDKIIAGKQAFFFFPLSGESGFPLFWLLRFVIYFAAWYLIFLQIRKHSLAEDQIKDPEHTHYYKQSFWATIFIVVFAVTSSTSAWDWVLSIDTHWFSTMFGWYVFASWHVTGLAVITLTIVILKEKGYLKIVNDSHLHDLGKFMFAFSVFWTYIWVAQFLLIYYANIPEEITYWLARWKGGELYGFSYTPVFFLNLVVNFIFPFLFLMTRDAKRRMVLLKVAACGIIGGHWLDFYLMIEPATNGKYGNIGLIEFGTTAIYAGAFVLVVGTQLAKNLLIAKNHPMLEESIHHDI